METVEKSETKLDTEKLASVKIGDKWGYINAAGEVVIEPRFDDARYFTEGLAIVRIDEYERGKYG